MIPNGGKKPKWTSDNEFEFLVSGETDDCLIKFQVMDEDTISNDLVGEGDLKLGDLVRHGDLENWFGITYKG